MFFEQSSKWKVVCLTKMHLKSKNWEGVFDFQYKVAFGQCESWLRIFKNLPCNLGFQAMFIFILQAIKNNAVRVSVKVFEVLFKSRSAAYCVQTKFFVALTFSTCLFGPQKSSAQHVEGDLNKTSKTLTETLAALFLFA